MFKVILISQAWHLRSSIKSGNGTKSSPLRHNISPRNISVEIFRLSTEFLTFKLNIFQSLYEGLPSQHCATLFSSYIILVTASTFNLMAITTTEIYHFTNKLVEISVSNFCCVCFGITLVWVTSVVVNLGVAFMPSISTFHKEVMVTVSG